MGCEFCKQKKLLMDMPLVSTTATNFYDSTSSLNINNPIYSLGVFIDRDHLRLIDLDDCNCIEGGQKIKINFCPICGEKI